MYIGGRGPQHYEMHHVPPKTAPFLSPFSPDDPLVCVLSPTDPHLLSPKDPKFLILSPKNPSFELFGPKFDVTITEARILRDLKPVVNLMFVTLLPKDLCFTTLSPKDPIIFDLSPKDPLFFWLLLSPKDPYVWDVRWHLYVNLIYECPPPPMYTNTISNAQRETNKFQSNVKFTVEPISLVNILPLFE